MTDAYLQALPEYEALRRWLYEAPSAAGLAVIAAAPSTDWTFNCWCEWETNRRNLYGHARGTYWAVDFWHNALCRHRRELDLCASNSQEDSDGSMLQLKRRMLHGGIGLLELREQEALQQLVPLLQADARAALAQRRTPAPQFQPALP